MVLNGCTVVSFANYHGKVLEGEVVPVAWIDNFNKQWDVKTVDDTLPLRIMNHKNKIIEFKAIMTEIEKDVYILWVLDDKSNTFKPCRVLVSDTHRHCWTLLYPDIDEIKKLVDTKKIKGEYKDDYWLLDGAEAVGKIKCQVNYLTIA